VLVVSISQAIGVTTNNQAEYRAIITALQKAIGLGVKQVDIYLDSLLVVKQVNGQYRVKNPALKPLFQQVRRLQGKFNHFTIRHVTREQNREADRLANQALN
jgi:ribonuclease HI